MQAVYATRFYTRSASFSISITSICLILLIPRDIKQVYFLPNKFANCDLFYNIFYFFKFIPLFCCLLMVFYRIYFYSNWYIYAEYIEDDTSMKTMMIEVMVYQRGYRMVYYGIITIISSRL